MYEDVKLFVAKQRKEGYTDNQIEEMLLKAGWSKGLSKKLIGPSADVSKLADNLDISSTAQSKWNPLMKFGNENAKKYALPGITVSVWIYFFRDFLLLFGANWTFGILAMIFCVLGFVYFKKGPGSIGIVAFVISFGLFILLFFLEIFKIGYFMHH